MNNFTILAELLLKDIPADEKETFFQTLSVMTDLIREKGKLIQSINEEELSQFLDKLPGCPRSAKSLIMLMHKNKLLLKLPKLQTGLDRAINRAGYLKLTIETPSEITEISTQKIKKWFGDDIVSVHKTDKRIFAGTRITVNQGISYEYSYRVLLDRLNDALTLA